MSCKHWKMVYGNRYRLWQRSPLELQDKWIHYFGNKMHTVDSPPLILGSTFSTHMLQFPHSTTNFTVLPYTPCNCSVYQSPKIRQECCVHLTYPFIPKFCATLDAVTCVSQLQHRQSQQFLLSTFTM
jgi:hypothetical protein